VAGKGLAQAVGDTIGDLGGRAVAAGGSDDHGAMQV
jgi:hypothetical protein